MRQKLSSNYYDISKIDEFIKDYIEFLNKYNEKAIGIEKGEILIKYLKLI